MLYGENEILSLEILTDEKVRKKGILDYIYEITKDYSCYLEELI